MSIQFPNQPLQLKMPIAVIGLGISGRAILTLLKKLGYRDSDLVTFDDKDLSSQFQDPKRLLSEAIPQTLVVSPGVSLKKAWLTEYLKAGGTITSELEISFSCLQNERVVGVTGSVGKSTVVSILDSGLKAFSKSHFVGGNLGTPLANYISELIAGKRERADWVILELSSYQLETFKNLSLEFGIISSLTPNHLERYDSLENYYHTKVSIIEKCKKAIILNQCGGDLVSYLEKYIFQIPYFWTSADDKLMNRLKIKNSRLIGKHNLDNLAMAAQCAELGGWPAAAFLGMTLFSGLAHRLENLGTHKDTLFINDSKATTVESVLQAVKSVEEAVPSGGRLVLLLGGRDKNLPWEKLSEFAKNSMILPFFFGECRSEVERKSGLPGSSFKTLKACLDSVKSKIQPNDVVLLSPGGTSLDEFKNFEERGDFFKKWVDSF